MSRSQRNVVHAIRSDSFAGVERYVVNVATELHSRGWSVQVVGGAPHRMRSELPAGVPHVSAGSTLGVARELVRVKGGVIHSHMSAADLAAAVTGLRAASRVSTRHFAAPRGSGPAARPLMRMVERRLHASVAISDFVAAAGGGSDVVIHNGVPPIEVTTTWHERRNQVLVMQRLEPEKDTQTALNAWRLSTARRQGWRMVVAGRGSQAEHMRAQATQLGIEDTVDFAGFVSAPQQLLQQSKIFLATAPSEPFGLSVVEAMASGTPVSAADGGAHRETLGPHGRYFNAGSAEACAASLDELVAMGKTAAEYGLMLRERQIADFSVSVHVDALEALYLKLLTAGAA